MSGFVETGRVCEGEEKRRETAEGEYCLCLPRTLLSNVVWLQLDHRTMARGELHETQLESQSPFYSSQGHGRWLSSLVPSLSFSVLLCSSLPFISFVFCRAGFHLSFRILYSIPCFLSSTPVFSFFLFPRVNASCQ